MTETEETATETLPEPAAESASDANVAAIKTAEEWAALRGYLPEKSPGPKKPGKPDAIVPPVHNPKSRLHFEAFFLHGWALNKEMTLADYDKAVEAARAHVYR
jgi:hypothetical protein